MENTPLPRDEFLEIVEPEKAWMQRPHLAAFRAGGRLASPPLADVAATGGTGLTSMRSKGSAALAASGSGPSDGSPREVIPLSGPTVLLPFQPATMSGAQLSAVAFLARYSGRTHILYAYQLREWFAWCESNGVDPLVGVQRAHVELYIRRLGDRGLMDSSVVTMMHAVRGYFRFAHIDGLIGSDPAVYARLPKIHRDQSRTQGLDRLELIRFLQIAQTLTVHHGALGYLLGINALRASEAAAVMPEASRQLADARSIAVARC